MLLVEARVSLEAKVVVVDQLAVDVAEVVDVVLVEDVDPVV